MPDIRTPTAEWTLGDKTYKLTMNFNVLADLQESAGGDITKVLSRTRSFRAAAEIGAALINEAADIAGWPERYTARQLGRLIPPTDTVRFSEMCINLLFAALQADEDSEKDEAPAEGGEKN